jgi:ABC-type multidrug transport system permease subunit
VRRELGRKDAFAALVGARFREFSREPEAIFWTFVFPVMLTVALGFAFRNRPLDPPPVAVVDGAGARETLEALAAGRFRAEAMSEEAAARALRIGRVDLVVVPRAGGAPEYRLDPTRPESALARLAADDALQRAAGRADAFVADERAVLEPGSRYVDFLVPGLIGLGLMNGGLWGVGFGLVDMRIKKLLKRMLATPVRRPDFMGALMAVRLLTMFVEVGFLLAFARLALGVPLRGSLGAVFAVGALGALAFGSLGVLLASRATRIESVIGLMNLVSLPMTIACGVFFSIERFPAAAQPLLRALPLALVNDALRAILNEGASLASQSGSLLALAAWGLVCLALGLRLFKWS